MTWRWPSPRIWRRIALGLAATLLIAVLALRLFALTPMARGLVEARVEALSVRGQVIELEGFKGDVLGRMSVQSLTVRDNDGIWASASDVELAWGPLGLLSGHLRLKDITADTIDIARRPVLAPRRANGSGGSFLSRYTIQSLNVNALSLDAGLAGPAQAYALSGRLEAGGATGQMALDLTPLAGRGDEARLELDWGGAVPLLGRVDIRGVPGGFIATLLGAPDQAAVTASLDASGTADNWQIEAESSVGGAAILDLTARAETTGYSAEGSLAFEQLAILQALRTRFGDRLTFQATLDPQQRLTGAVTAQTLNATFAGDLEILDGGVALENFALDANDVTASALTGLRNLDLTDLTAAGRLDLASGTYRFDGVIQAPRVTYGSYQLVDARSDGSLGLGPAALVLDGDIAAAALTGLPAALQRALDDNLNLSIAASLDRGSRTLSIDQFALDAARSAATGGGQYTFGGAVDLSGDLSLTSLNPIGRFTGDWNLRGARFSEAELSLNGPIAFAGALAPLQQIAGDDTRLDLTFKRDQGGLILRTATLQSDNFQADASGTLKQGQLTIAGDLAAKTAALPPLETNELDAQFQLSGPVQAPRLSVTASAANLIAAGRAFERPRLSGDLALTGDTAFSIQATADYLDAPLTVELAGSRPPGAIQLTEVAADWADLQATGDAVLVPSNLQASRIDLAIIGAPPTLGEIDAQISYLDETLDGTLLLSETTLGPLAIESSQIALRGVWPNFSGTLEYDADMPLLGDTRSISGDHDITANAEARALTLGGAFRLADQTFDLTAPLMINLNEGLFIEGQVAAFDGHIDLALRPLADAPSELTLSDLALQKFGPLINRPALRGTLNGSANIALAENGLSGGASATIAGLARGSPDAPSADLRLAAQINANQLEAELRTEDADQALNFAATLAAPLTHQGDIFSIRLAPDAAIPMRVRGNGPIAPLWALAAPTDLRLEGDLSVDLNNGGGATRRFEGPLSFQNGIFEDGITGLHLKQIAVDAALRQDGIQVEAASARGTSGGRVEASGLYGFDGNSSVVLDLNGLNAFKRSDVSASVSGRAEIDRSNRRTQVSGRLVIDQARVNLERLPGAGYTTLNVVFTDQLDDAGGTAPVREAISLDLDVSADRRIFVVGSGVDTEWGLNARVSGSPGRPNIIGRATLIRGEADLLSRRFRFSEGLVQFVGAPADSEITLRADRTSDDITSSITLSGTMADPEITLSAVPSLPDDEILARVLFGRSPSELSPLQAAQLAGAAAQLAGGDALNLVGQLQEATGLDRLDFGLDEDGAATLSTGKYLAEDVYLEIESGGTGAPGVALEWTPLENVAIDAEVDPELGPKVAIQWKRDFDRLPGEPDSD